jgi:hypothetical protein
MALRYLKIKKKRGPQSQIIEEYHLSRIQQDQETRKGMRK